MTVTDRNTKLYFYILYTMALNYDHNELTLALHRTPRYINKNHGTCPKTCSMVGFNTILNIGAVCAVYVI